MTKKTIMELLREANKKRDIKGPYYMNRLFSQAMDDANDLHFESIEQHVAVHTLDALERIANALESNANQMQDRKIKRKKALIYRGLQTSFERKSNAKSKTQTQIKGKLTYHEFFKEFNKKSDYHARQNNRGWVDIVLDGKLIASFLPHTGGWYFTETESSFPADELMLMTQLAATPPDMRGDWRETLR